MVPVEDLTVPHLRKAYFELPEAFDRAGRMHFRKKWNGRELGCERSIEQFASTLEPRSDEESRYKAARIELFEWIYEGRIPVSGMSRNGKADEIPAHAWKNEDGEFTISIRNNRVTWNWEEETPEWRVRVDRPKLIATLWEIHKREFGANKPQSNGMVHTKPGAPYEYEWLTFDEFILDLYESDAPPRSANRCAEIVEAKFDGAPSPSQLRERVRLLRERGLLP